MPTRITHFLHDSVVTGAQNPGTAFTTAASHVHDMQANMAPLIASGRPFRGIVQGVHIRLSSAGNVAVTKATMRICADAAGNEVLVPDTEAPLVAGVSDATIKSCAFKLDLPLHQILAVSGDLYLFVKLDANTGAPVLSRTTISWSE